MTVKQAIVSYERLVKNVFSDKKSFSSSGSGAFKLSKLKQTLLAIIQDATGNEDELMMDERSFQDACKTYV